MIFFCPECDKTLNGDYVETETYKGEIVCIDCFVERRNDYYQMLVATGKYTPLQLDIEADNYIEALNKFYGGKA